MAASTIKRIGRDTPIDAVEQRLREARCEYAQQRAKQRQQNLLTISGSEEARAERERLRVEVGHLQDEIAWLETVLEDCRRVAARQAERLAAEWRGDGRNVPW